MGTSLRPKIDADDAVDKLIRSLASSDVQGRG